MDLDDEELKATRRMNGSDKNVVCMGRNIKLVENLIEEYKMFGDLDGIQDLRTYMEATEHLIKAYKELKQENRKLSKANETYIKSIQNITPVLMNDYIEKSLVEEKIEEYEEKAKRIAGTYQYADSGEDLESKKKQVIELRTKAEGLQELLEGK